MKKKILILMLCVTLLSGTLGGCTKNEDLGDPVTITVAGAWKDCIALDAVGDKFTEKYPNVTVVYEQVQESKPYNFYQMLEQHRMQGDNRVDLFFTDNIQGDDTMLPYALDLYGSDLDLSNTFQGLVDNFVYRNMKSLYAIPLGADIRGIYVNVSLLKSVGVNEVPTNQQEFLAACDKLKEAELIPVHGNPGRFAQQLMYPWVANIIANAEDYQATFDAVANPTEGIAEMFKEPFEFLYNLMANYYYDYKTAQNEPWVLFKSDTAEAYAKDFLDVTQENDQYVNKSELGRVAFMASTYSDMSTIEKIKEESKRDIEYVFIPAPIGEDGGFVYLSPAKGIAINKFSLNKNWSVKFLDFLFEAENNKIFAEKFNIIPNTKEAFSYVTQLFDVPSDRISHVGQVTFPYAFFDIVAKRLVDTCKGNNPSYMNNGELYSLDYYLDKLEASLIAKQV